MVCGAAASQEAEGTICRRVGLLEQALVAGEETRSRKAGENTEVPARHLVPLGAALRACDTMRTGCGDGAEFHWPVPLG